MQSNFQDVKEFFLNTPVERELTFQGRIRKFWFRRISGAERLKINRGQKITVGDQQKHTMDVEMSDIEARKYLMVEYATCNEDGTRLFRNTEQVRELPEIALELLYKHAEETNKEDPELGKN